MKANELRIGNYVNFKSRKDILYCEVTEISIDLGTHIIRHFKDGYKDDQPETIDDLTPIPLTEDWLLKFGFRKFENKFGAVFEKRFGDNINEKEQVSFYNSGAKGFFVSSYLRQIKIEYVHQLQNLYFAVTGKELTIK